MNSGEEPHPSHATVKQIPARRKQPYFKGGGELQRKKYHKRSVLSSSSHPHPSSSPSLVNVQGWTNCNDTWSCFPNHTNFSDLCQTVTTALKMAMTMTSLQTRHPQHVIAEDYMLHFLPLQTAKFPIHQGPRSQVLQLIAAVPTHPYILLQLLVPVCHQPRGQLKSYLTSQNAQGGRAHPAQVTTVAQQMDGKLSCFISFVGHLL